MRITPLLVLAVAGVAVSPAAANGPLAAATIKAEEETEFVEKKGAVAQVENGAAEKDMSMVVKLLADARALVAGLPASKAQLETMLGKAKVQLTYAAGRVAKASQEITLEQEGTLKLQEIDAENNGAAQMAAKAESEEGEAQMDEAKATKVIADVEKLVRETAAMAVEAVESTKQDIIDGITEAIQKTSSAERFVSKAGKKVADSEVDVAEVEKTRAKSEMGIASVLKNAYHNANRFVNKLHANVASKLPHFKLPVVEKEANKRTSQEQVASPHHPVLPHSGFAAFHHPLAPYVPHHMQIHHPALAPTHSVTTEVKKAEKQPSAGSAFDAIE